MAAISLLNPKTERAKAYEALSANISSAIGLKNYLKRSFGPRGTMKMIVSGGGDIKISKDGKVILEESPFRHATASLIGRTCTSQDASVGDGTTTTVLLIGEILKQADFYLQEGVHPRKLIDGVIHASDMTIKLLEDIKIDLIPTKENLNMVAKTALVSKVTAKLANILASVCVDAVCMVREEDKPADLSLVEIMKIPQRTQTHTSLIQGMVMDHGSRHPGMPKRVTNAYILTINVSLEYERTEINSEFMYKDHEELQKFVLAEREVIDDRCRKIVALKKKLCNGTDKTFVVVNQKGIDPFSLEILAEEGIIALRRAKSKNMHRITLACGGIPLNSLEDIDESCVGRAGLVYEQVLGETKYTFIEECTNPKAVTIVINGPSRHSRIQVEEAVRDGLKAVFNAIEDKCILPGAGCCEIYAYNKLLALNSPQLGYKVFADALLVIPKTLAENSGLDIQETILKLLDADISLPGQIGLDLTTGEPKRINNLKVYDNYCVKKQVIKSSAMVACNLLSVDEILRAGYRSLKEIRA